MSARIAAAVVIVHFAAVPSRRREVRTGTTPIAIHRNRCRPMGAGRSRMEVQPTDDAIAVARSMARCLVVGSTHAGEGRALMRRAAAIPQGDQPI